MRTLVLCLGLALMAVSPRATGRPLILAADQSDYRILLYDPAAPRDQAPLWSFPASPAKGDSFMPTDAKQVISHGEPHILAAYHGRVRLIRQRDHQVIKDFPAPQSCHSAALLPDGCVVTASSNDAKLRLHRGTDDFLDLPLPYAHGAEWDAKRKCLWALGDKLCRFTYHEGRLEKTQDYPLPQSPTGHDLFPLRDYSQFLISNEIGLFLFDPEAETFATISTQPHIKSASQAIDSAIWVTRPKQLPKAGEWQTDTIAKLDKDGHLTADLTRPGARFYKARWCYPSSGN